MKDNFTFLKNLILGGKKFKRCDKPHSSDACKKMDTLIIFRDGTRVITKMNDSISKHLQSKMKGI